jgi:opacity protein-like surface antigen
MKDSIVCRTQAVFLAIVLGIAFASGSGLPSTGQGRADKSRLPLFSLKLSAGAANLHNGTGDPETFRQQIEGLYGSLLNGFLAPSYKAVFHWPERPYVPDFALDLMMRINDRMAIALGSGYFWNSSRGDYSFDYSHARPNGSLEEDSASYAQKFRIGVVPITLNLYFFQPVGGFDVFAYGGLGYYFGRLTHDYSVIASLMNTTGSAANPSSQTIFDETLTVSEKAHAGALGLQGGAGIEFELARGLTLGAEVYDRFLNFKNWQGDSTAIDQTRDRRYSSSRGWYRDDQRTSQGQDTGTMWYGLDRDPWLGLISDILYVGDSRQPNDSSEFRKRSASVNLSTVGLKIGLRFQFDLPWF